MGGASARQLQSPCKMYFCFCKSTKMYMQLRVPTYNHNYFVLHCCLGFSASAGNDVTARASSWLVNTGTNIRQSSDFSTRANGPSNFQFVPRNSRWFCLRVLSTPVETGLVRIPITELSNSNLTSIITIRELYKWIFTSHMSPLWPLYLFLCMHIWVALRKYFHIMT